MIQQHMKGGGAALLTQGRKRKRINIDRIESQSLSCVRGGSHFRAAVEPAMDMRDNPVGPLCAAPFKGRDSQSACQPERPGTFCQRDQILGPVSLPQ